MISRKRLFCFLLLLLPLCAILSQCFSDKKQDPRDRVFAGAQACISCHKSIVESYAHTAHFGTSRLADLSTIHGSFKAGQNVFSFGNGMQVTMEKHGDSLSQAGCINGKPAGKEAFDITVGGVKAETYLYWKGSQLFQLPMSYFSALHSWTNSPGYDTGRINFTRPIITRCLECHSSYIKELPNQNLSLTNRAVEYDKSSLIMGIDCERCHGPAANHVNYHTAYPEVKEAKYITTYKSLTRQQKMDACAVCHSGNKDVFNRSAFAFKMGDTLAKFKEHNFNTQPVNPATLDVHGNQNDLLASSKCFISSSMDCNTCHNVHRNESSNLAMYTAKCVSCHTAARHQTVCKLLPVLGDAAIKAKCIDCHMPAKPSNMIQVEDNGNKMKVPYLVRTHRIAVYPQESEKITAYIKSH